MIDNNLKTYNSFDVVKWYEHLDAINLVEKIFFEKNIEFLSRAKVLDIGIGGGRTTNYLIKKCKSYTGIDYSNGFVDVVKKNYPNSDIHLMDARDLIAFENNTFDLVNFSFNGIDYVGLDDRKKILSEINRVLKPNGILFFSTHNKNHSTFKQSPWLDKNNSTLTNIKTFIKLLPFLPRHLNQTKKEIDTNEYSIINDSAHNYSLLTFYTTAQFLKQQLLEFNYTDVVFLSKHGKPEPEENLGDWIFVSCKKLLP